ncbi:hypothetical protein AXF42_Ash011587 [Apostasia shenzhenica]|uniref:Uncharacterized protein n=1 Tax=Apostasia shenzhenica TaxID=1088818 RepID=A0A2I0BB11_9ASPA|nr:hypothetical protein AXF42_Ash011587 [Apostasia shenzhenica]
MKKILKKIGLGYIKIDVCPNNCVIYYGANNSDTSCAICGYERFKPSHNKQRKVSYKVLRYLPITLRLQRLYMSRFTAEHMT